jgi:NADH-quinone oxidoreductase subunit J
MSVAGAVEIIAFALSAFIAVAGALGMATTMSMFRSAIFLMASFMGVAGLFILLSADLLGLLQIMMYIGGMLVMVLFMVLFMQDPGGAMMASMLEMMTPIERFFSLGLAQKNAYDGASEQAADRHGKDDEKKGSHADGEQHGADQMADMSMVTPVRGWAALLALATGSVLVALLVLRPSWPLSSAVPDPHSARQVGSLLMDKYMIAFEGAGFLILIGIVGSVFAARSGQHPDRGDRNARVAVDAPPPVEADGLAPRSRQLHGDEHHAARGGSE